ncbi:MAG: hypothetical protein HYV63_21705 [Candidatus Schekmanbacteria bacterium]|nr:hypothetical protein [Candidatus Schekmanbacteria bacterium]
MSSVDSWGDDERGSLPEWSGGGSSLLRAGAGGEGMVREGWGQPPGRRFGRLWPGISVHRAGEAHRCRMRRAALALSVAAVVLGPLLGGVVVSVVFPDTFRASPSWIAVAPLPPRAPVLGRLLDGRPALERGVWASDRAADQTAVAAADDAHLWLGVDRFGHALLDRLVLGFAAFLGPAVLAVAISLGAGMLLAALLRYPDRLLRVRRAAHFAVDLLASQPRLMLLLATGAATSFDLTAMMVALGILNIPRAVAAIGHQFDLLSRQGLLEALREANIPAWRIVGRHVLWCHCRHLLLVQAAVGMADALMTEATLSALQYGGQDVSWGAMVFQGRMDVYSGIYWTMGVPVGAIVLTLLAFHQLAEGIALLTSEKGAA